MDSQKVDWNESHTRGQVDGAKLPVDTLGLDVHQGRILDHVHYKLVSSAPITRPMPILKPSPEFLFSAGSNMFHRGSCT